MADPTVTTRTYSWEQMLLEVEPDHYVKDGYAYEFSNGRKVPQDQEVYGWVD